MAKWFCMFIILISCNQHASYSLKNAQSELNDFNTEFSNKKKEMVELGSQITSLSRFSLLNKNVHNIQIKSQILNQQSLIIHTKDSVIEVLNRLVDSINNQLKIDNTIITKIINKKSKSISDNDSLFKYDKTRVLFDKFSKNINTLKQLYKRYSHIIDEINIEYREETTRQNIHIYRRIKSFNGMIKS